MKGARRKRLNPFRNLAIVFNGIGRARRGNADIAVSLPVNRLRSCGKFRGTTQHHVALCYIKKKRRRLAVVAKLFQYRESFLFEAENVTHMTKGRRKEKQSAQIGNTATALARGQTPSRAPPLPEGDGRSAPGETPGRSTPACTIRWAAQCRCQP